MDNTMINVLEIADTVIYVKKFSITPGSRYIDEGPHSGQEFREKFLQPEFEKIINSDSKITIDLDGTIGFGTSWLEEVFGGLARTFDKNLVMEKLEFISKEEDYLIEDIQHYILNA